MPPGLLPPPAVPPPSESGPRHVGAGPRGALQVQALTDAPLAVHAGHPPRRLVRAVSRPGAEPHRQVVDQALLLLLLLAFIERPRAGDAPRAPYRAREKERLDGRRREHAVLYPGRRALVVWRRQEVDEQGALVEGEAVR